MKKVRTVYLVRDAVTRDAARPEVQIEKTAQGRYAYRVRVSARTLEAAMERALPVFRALRAECRALEQEDAAGGPS